MPDLSYDNGAVLAHAQALAAAFGTPEIREFVLEPYVLLYAHSAGRVVLRALRHERERSFRFGTNLDPCRE